MLTEFLKIPYSEDSLSAEEAEELERFAMDLFYQLENKVTEMGLNMTDSVITKFSQEELEAMPAVYRDTDGRYRIRETEPSDIDDSIDESVSEEVNGMTFKDFIHADKSLAMVITIEEYKRIKPLLQEFYSEKDFAHIDDYCRFLPSSERFLLCNPHEKSQIGTPMMCLNAVTFIDRISFKNIVFDEMELEWPNYKQKYVLQAYYTAASGERTLADLVVTEPQMVEDGIWATSETNYGGYSRHFYRACDVVSLRKKDTDISLEQKLSSAAQRSAESGGHDGLGKDEHVKE